MTTTTLLSTPFLNLLLHEGDSRAIETEWLGFAGSTGFRAALTEALRLAREYRPTGWLANDHHLGAVRPKDLDWAATDLLMPLGQLGVRRLARYEARDTLNRLTIDSMYTTSAPAFPFEVQVFGDLAEARAWLTSAVG